MISATGRKNSARNHPINLNGIVHRSGKHLVFDDRHIVLLRDLPDLQSKQILPLGKHGGGRILAMLVFQRDGEVSWIGDDQCRAGDGREHRLSRTIARDRPQTRLDERIALGLLELVLEFLLRHAQFATPVETRPGQVQRYQNDRRDADRRHKPHRRRQDQLRDGGRVAEQCIHGHGLLSPQDDRHDNANRKELKNGLRRLHTPLAAKYPFPPWRIEIRENSGLILSKTIRGAF